MIPRHRLTLVFSILLPLLALRATLPMGFVPSVDEHARRIVACSTGLTDLEAPAKDPFLRDLDGHAEGYPADCAAPATAPPQNQTAGAATSGSRIAFLKSLLPSPSDGPPRAAGARAPPTFL